jgi:hypothetical protein
MEQLRMGLDVCLLCDPFWRFWRFRWFDHQGCVYACAALLKLTSAGFGFNSFHSILMQMPTGAIQIVFLILSIWLTNKIKLRFPILAVLCLFPIGGAVGLLMVPRDRPSALLGCYYVALILGCLRKFVGRYTCTCLTHAEPLLYSWANLNAAGHTKKVCTTAVMFVFQCVGNIIGPQVYLAREAPKYFTGLYVDIACWCLLCKSP